MAKINIKNTNRNPLISFLKQSGISFKSKDRRVEGNEVVEKIVISTPREENLEQIERIISDYGIQLYHDTTFHKDMKLENTFVYSSNDYENSVAGVLELELPNFYVENTNDQNTDSRELKALGTNLVSKEYINSLGSKQGLLLARTSEQLNKFKNILFGHSYSNSRSNSNLNEFPYYNTVHVLSHHDKGTLSVLLEKIKFQEEILGGILNEKESLEVPFDVNGVQTEIPVKDFMSVIRSNPLSLNIENTLTLGTSKQNSNFMINNFKKSLVNGALYGNLGGDLLSFTEMLDAIECKREVLAYKIDKFADNDSEPLQSFWMYTGNTYHDYQILKDKTYKYKLSCYCLIYGVESRITDVNRNANTVSITLTSVPSYKYALIEFDEDSVKVSPKIPMPPHASFHNENNEENIVKIYLSLKNGSRKAPFIPITEADSEIISGIESKDGLYEFDYELQDGKFEVYRLTEMPKSYSGFEDAKILDVRNRVSTTDVIFKENVQSNKKYYFMFRSVNVIGVPSNPSPVYEVELIKMASTSKINVRVVTMKEEVKHMDKTFKNLLQIKPAFQQDIFDDQSEQVQELSTFKKKINDLTLGTATDKVWGKKFKIRVKSKDTGKIIDLNVKFNLIKDNIK
jgi:hypothetical protein